MFNKAFWWGNLKDGGHLEDIEADHYHQYHLYFMELGHLLTHCGLTYPDVSSKVYHDSFCQLRSSVSLLWVIYSPSSSLSSHIFHGVGPLVDPFRSHVPRSLFKGLS